MNRFRKNEVFYSGGEVCLKSGRVPKVMFYDQSEKLLCNVIIVRQVGDILRFVDLLIKCNFSPELIYY